MEIVALIKDAATIESPLRQIVIPGYCESEQVVRNKCMKQLTSLLDENAEVKRSLKNSLVYGS